MSEPLSAPSSFLTFTFTFEPVDDDSAAGQRWSTWDDIGILAGPEPWPDWLITESAAIDTELGILKTGKEADVHLLERATEDRSVVMAAKRYRGLEHRLFHRDAGYTEGRRDPQQPRPAGRRQGHPLGPQVAGRAVGCGPSSASWPTSGRPGSRCPTRCSWTTPRS